MCNNKIKSYKISEVFQNNYFKINTNENNFEFNKINTLHNNLIHLVLKISGIWESKDSIGLTFKIIQINNFIEFYPSVEKIANKM